MHTPRNASAQPLRLLVLALSLTACAAPLPPPPSQVQPPRVLPPPAELMEPPSSGSWSENAQQLFRRWQKLLTPATPS